MNIANADQVYRELPFVVNQSKVDQIELEDEGVSIIQGMIDLIYVSEGQYYFVDYKTDAFNRRKGLTDEEIGQQLKDKYQIQMKYYRNTLETILQTKVKGYLYFFKFGMLEIDDHEWFLAILIKYDNQSVETFLIFLLIYLLFHAYYSYNMY